MKLKKLLAKAEKLLEPEKRKRDLQRKGLKKLVKKLREYEREARSRIESEPDPKARAKLEKKARLAHAQRKKALALMDE